MGYGRYRDFWAKWNAAEHVANEAAMREEEFISGLRWQRVRAGEYVTECGYRIRRDAHLRQWSAWDPEGFCFTTQPTLGKAQAVAEWWEANGRVPVTA